MINIERKYLPQQAPMEQIANTAEGLEVIPACSNITCIIYWKCNRKFNEHVQERRLYELESLVQFVFK